MKKIKPQILWGAVEDGQIVEARKLEEFCKCQYCRKARMLIEVEVRPVVRKQKAEKLATKS